MVVVTAAIGFFLATSLNINTVALIACLAGTALLASGASVLNQVVERHHDARMRRTAKRPIPAGRIDVATATAFGFALALAGTAVLWLWTDPLTTVIGVLTLMAYVLVYTPLKRFSSLATIVGAVPGATPPMMGATAAVGGELQPIAWALFGILFLWQMPHFLAIAWLYREDYARGGFPMLPVGELRDGITARQAILWAAALIPVSLLPTLLGHSGPIYLIGALILGLLYLGYTARFGIRSTPRTARSLVLMSVFYLPLSLVLMLVDRAIFLLW